MLWQEEDKSLFLKIKVLLSFVEHTKFEIDSQVADFSKTALKMKVSTVCSPVRFEKCDASPFYRIMFIRINTRDAHFCIDQFFSI